MPEKWLALWMGREGKGDLETVHKLNELFASLFMTDDLGQIVLPERPFLKKVFNKIQVLLLKPHRSPGGSCLEAWKWFQRDSSRKEPFFPAIESAEN